jgi:hypothetical protein
LREVRGSLLLKQGGFRPGGPARNKNQSLPMLCRTVAVAAERELETEE